jgi:hypothetical protein
MVAKKLKKKKEITLRILKKLGRDQRKKLK